MNRSELYARIGSHGAIAALDRAVFKLTGADRVRYLNGQVSNDVRKLTPAETMHACVMTAKGKMCADIFITAGADHLLVDADPSLRESVAARLERYIISDDVTLEDVTEEFFLAHHLDPHGSASVTNEPPFTKRKSRRYGRDGWDFFLTPEEHSGVEWRKFANGFPTLDGELLETLRIEAGLPRWGAELGEEILPNEAGLEKTAIDYHKGCYIGQEVGTRLKIVGHVNKQLRGFISTAGKPLEAGMSLFTPDAPDRKIGWLTSATCSFALEKPIALGYLKRGTAAETLNARPANDAGTENACPVLVIELPFIP